jgi:thiamine-phosphate pyrophosphorylase
VEADDRRIRADVLLYYITDRSQFPGDDTARRRAMLENIAQAVRSGVDFIQLREKDLFPRELEILAREAVAIVHQPRTGHQLRTGNQKLKTGVLINSRTDIAVACAADGVHLRSHDMSAAEVRKIWSLSGAGALARVTVGVSCHTPTDVAKAAEQGADFAVFGPIFEKKSVPDTHPAGLEALRQACREKIPVLALGGVTSQNAEACIQAGAAGIAGIRLFQEGEISTVVRQLREPTSRGRPGV